MLIPDKVDNFSGEISVILDKVDNFSGEISVIPVSYTHLTLPTKVNV